MGALGEVGALPALAALPVVGYATAPGMARDHWRRRSVARSHQSMVSALAVIRSSRLAVNSAAARETELPQFPGGAVMVVDRLIQGVGVDLVGA
jgi:hypothetical protein